MPLSNTKTFVKGIGVAELRPRAAEGTWIVHAKSLSPILHSPNSQAFTSASFTSTSHNQPDSSSLSPSFSRSGSSVEHKLISDLDGCDNLSQVKEVHAHLLRHGLKPVLLRPHQARPHAHEARRPSGRVSAPRLPTGQVPEPISLDGYDSRVHSSGDPVRRR
ncbi:hypothetical protein L3X38_039358 [Prunus dulcis]|uniref:Uncharacterized protein n=1 Tax=Prunus dulcis TaxID=3755 RepID=A0AAD4V6U5_PRUDU|nr:hypothetical protein L3X38_039358 [Prunus dulcis]